MTAAPGATGAPHFNLWFDPWIGVEDPSGPRLVGIERAFREAHALQGLQDPSPLVTASVHRLLTGVLQAIVHPDASIDIRQLLRCGEFSADAIADFGRRYADHFDLFSAARPFMQTADVPLSPPKSVKTKTVAYLFPELPTGTNVIHWHHARDDDYLLCPPCAASGLITWSAFATAGGSGIKPSINGVPPLYVLPLGRNLFESLTLSLLTPPYQPQVAEQTHDQPAWDRPPIIPRGEEVLGVGYLESLTFPARRVRLFPDAAGGRCSRCGCTTRPGVREMVFEMGLSRPKDAAFWFDPFVAYVERAEKVPVPVRPLEGKAVWREYGSLFLTTSQMGNKARAVRPGVVGQIEDVLRRQRDRQTMDFRCIGMRTDMKTKVFEWVDAPLPVRPGLLEDSAGAQEVSAGLSHADTWAGDLRYAFAKAFFPSPRRKHHESLRDRMTANYWMRMFEPFLRFVLTEGDLEAARRAWDDEVLQIGLDEFTAAVEAVGDRGSDLKTRVQAVARCRARRVRRKEEWTI